MPPSKKKDRNMTQIQLRIEDSLKEQFQEAAEKMSLPLSAWIRVKLIETLKHEKDEERKRQEG